MKKSDIAIALGIALPMLASKKGGKNTNPKAIFLVGMPSVGKSSLIKKEGWDKDPNTFIHSTDNIVDEIAKREGITYDDFFASGRFVQDVLPVLQERFQEAIKNGKNIVVDMVNESKAKRDLTLKDLPENYTKEAVVIGHEQWINQNPSFLQKIKDAVLERKITTGKSIPTFVLDSMFSSYEVPSEDEGFTVIEMIEPLNPLVKGAANKDDIKVIRVEKRRSKWGGKEHMKAMSRGLMFNPGEKIVGLAITLEGSDPQALKTHQKVRPILLEEAQKHRMFAPMIVFRSVYQSRNKPDTWEAIWDLS